MTVYRVNDLLMCLLMEPENKFANRGYMEKQICYQEDDHANSDIVYSSCVTLACNVLQY